MATKFKMTPKGWLAEDPRGLFVKMNLSGREYLGNVRDVYFNETRGCTLLKVQHFNGEMWPFEPSAFAVEIIQ